MFEYKYNRGWYQKGLMLFFILNSFNLLGASEALYWTNSSTNNSCDYFEGDISFLTIDVNNLLVFQIQYYLTDTADIILQVSNQPSFYGVTNGDYYIYALAYEINEPIIGNYSGNEITAISSKCSILSDQLPICVCPNLPNQRLVNGSVFKDTNEDGFDNENSTNLEGIQIQIYEDINQDGQVDVSDGLLTTIATNVSGQYSYTLDEAILGRFISHVVIQTDTSSIPIDFYLTTDNIETAIFASVDSIDLGNDFGISHAIDIENQIWLDLNGNGLQDLTEVPLADLDICIANLSPLLIEGILYPPNAFMDTITTDSNGVFIFNNIPDCNWQFVVHYDTALYVPTYDADGGILHITNFTTSDGTISAENNDWCDQEDCSTDLNYGFGLAGEYSLSGQVCIDDLTKDGTCNTGTETYLRNLVINIFDERGKKLGGIVTADNGSYEFPNLFPENYILDLNKVQNSINDYILVTTASSNDAIVVTTTKYAIFQKVAVQEDIGGIDFAFVLHIKTIAAKDDFNKLCPTFSFENDVSINDSTSTPLVSYRLVTSPQYGTIQMDESGTYQYENTVINCQLDWFTYELCDLVSGDCDEATVYFDFNDTIRPTLTNLPEDLTIHCNENIPTPIQISAFDNCPNIKIVVEETSTQGEDGCSLYDYQLTRVWTAIDACENTTDHTRTLTIKDEEAPNIFRIYTLPNGTKMVAGVTTLSTRWKTISLPIKFETTPLIFNQIISNEIDTPIIIIQTQKVSKSQFDIRLEQVSDQINNNNAYEKIAWIAVEKGTDSLTSIANFDLEINRDNATFPFNPNLVHLFTNQQTTYNNIPTFVDWEVSGNSTASVELLAPSLETTSLSNGAEEIGYWQVAKQALLHNKKGETIGETGTATVTSNWTTINLQHTFYNPIVIAQTNEKIGGLPVTIRIHQLTDNTFQIKTQVLANLNQVPVISMNYLVVEGSLPLDPQSSFCETGTDRLILGQDIRAIDNCDNFVDLSYSEIFQQNGLVKTTKRRWQSTDECDNQVTYEQTIECEGVGLKLQTYLQGALIGSNETGLMRDDLRRKKLIPLEDPYFKSPLFTAHQSKDRQTITDELLEITGPNAIVDWVYLDLRKGNNIDEVVAGMVGLLQRDGDIISPTGDSIIIFENIGFGDYFIGVHHRNHLSLLTQNTYSFDVDLIPEVDFKNVFTPVTGGNPSIKINNQSAQWSGDVNGDGKVIFQGPDNDPFHIFLAILLDEKNTQFLTNYISRGYSDIDFNMDGIIIFQGPNNDRSSLLYNTILVHPNNERLLTNFVISNN
ncbi:MAG: hypothetical protein AB8G86_12705 [Saprospiraceae bacterium]